jgi:hypothetical protein
MDNETDRETVALNVKLFCPLEEIVSDSVEADLLNMVRVSELCVFDAVNDDGKCDGVVLGEMVEEAVAEDFNKLADSENFDTVSLREEDSARVAVNVEVCVRDRDSEFERVDRERDTEGLVAMVRVVRLIDSVVIVVDFVTEMKRPETDSVLNTEKDLFEEDHVRERERLETVTENVCANSDEFDPVCETVLVSLEKLSVGPEGDAVCVRQEPVRDGVGLKVAPLIVRDSESD